MYGLFSEERARHPRPDFFRKNYQLLSGKWDFAFDDENVGIKENWQNGKTDFPMQILVPFTYQCEMSGIGDATYHPIIWYKRTFTLNENLSGDRVLIKFGAVDYKCDVYINSCKVLSHEGGYTPFSQDITEYLSDGENTLVVRVEDYWDTAQPRGKQYWNDGLMGCWYTPCSGIWQDVYLEKTGSLSVDYIHVTPDIDTHSTKIEVFLGEIPQSSDVSIEYTIMFGDRLVRKVTSSVPFRRYAISIDMIDANRIDSVKLWSPDTPNLYNLNVKVFKDGEPTDEVSTYFGMRKIEVKGGEVLLNNMPIYQRLVLDQGYWEESLLTPPSAEAIKKDVELIKAFGFNGVRKHQKIEDPRFYYWCDRLGLLCWGELPSAYEFNIASMNKLSRDMSEFIRRDYNHPSIIAWVPLNESWGVREIYSNKNQQDFSIMLYYLCKSLDQTRLVSGNDGWEQTVTDISAIHDYVAYGDDLTIHFKTREKVDSSYASWRMSFADGFAATEDSAFMVTEYGGIAILNKGIQGKISNMETWGYHEKVESEEEFIDRFKGLTDAIRNLPYCRGYCYTQLTDVMQEVNGLLTPDRVPKIDPQIIANININPQGY
ncbi:MAG TPA: glycoside hydrolase family 2 [Christensenellaceae bacterium]|nr:glycoside hydrolase family 2 [Christensenellaceae bacterium]